MMKRTMAYLVMWCMLIQLCMLLSGRVFADSAVLYSKAKFADGTYDLGEGNTGIQVVKLDVTPQYNGIDAIIAYLDSDDNTARPGFDFIHLTTSFRFKPEGYFDVKNGAFWSYETQLAYSAGTKYRFKMVIDLNQHKHSIWISPEGGTPVLIADNYDFRSNTTADDLGQLVLKSASDNSIVVTNHTVIGKSVFDAALQAVNTAATTAALRTAIESEQLAMSLGKYATLNEMNKTNVAQALLNQRGSGYTDDLALQAAIDAAVLAADTAPPTDPAVLNATPNQSLQVALSWGGATDDAGIKGYNVYRDNQWLVQTALTTYVDSADLAPGSVHTYKVTAVDYTGKESPGNKTAVATIPVNSLYFPFRQSSIDRALDEPPLAYTKFPDGVFEWHPSSMNSAAALYYWVVAAQYDPQHMTSGGETVADAALVHIRSMIAGGKEPGFSGNGLNGVGYNPAVQALVLTKQVPAIWNALSAGEQHKITLMMQAALVSAHWGYDDDNDFDTGLDQLGNFGKDFNPSMRNGGLGPGIAAIYYIGAAESNAFLLNFNYDAFMAELLAAGFTNIINTFSATGKAELEANTHNTGSFTYKGYTTAELHKWVQHLMTYTFALPVAPEGGEGTTKGYLVSGVADLPNVGLIGMEREFDSGDANGDRSSLVYASRGWANATRNLYTVQAFGGLDLLPPGEKLDLVQRMDIGTTDILYKAAHGYFDYQKGEGHGVIYYDDDNLIFRLTKELWQNVVDNPAAAVQAVNDAANTTAMTAALASADLGLILSGYNDLTPSARLNVAQAVADNKPAGGYATKAAVQDALYQAVTPEGLQAINAATDVPAMLAALESQALGLYMPTYYMSSTGQREGVAEWLLAEKPVGGFADKTTIMTMVAMALTPDGNQLKNVQPVLGGQKRIDLAAYNVWPANHGEAGIALWNDDKTGAFSFSIDRNHENELDRWLALTDEYGFDFTWFVTTNDIADPAKWEQLIAAGQDVQSNTASYLGNYTSIPVQQVHDEYAGAIQAIDALQGGNAKTIAYPNGSSNTYIASQYYIAGRDNDGFPNQADTVDYMLTKALGIGPVSRLNYTVPNDNSIEAMIKTLYDPDYKVWNGSYFRGWTNLYTQHSLDKSDINKTTNTTLRTEDTVRHMLNLLKAHEDRIWVGTYTDIAMYAEERDTALLTVTASGPNQIVFTLADRMDDDLFDYPLTIKVRVDNAWSNIVAVQGGKPLPVQEAEQNANRYALVKAVPDKGAVSLFPVSIQSVNAAATVAAMKTAITDSQLYFDLAKYDSLDESGRSRVAQRLIDLRPATGYAHRDDVVAALDNAVATVDVNRAVTVQEMKTAIASGIAALKLGAYTALSVANQDLAAQRMIEGRPANGYNAAASVQAVLDLATKVLSVHKDTIINVADTYISQAAASVDNNYGSANSLQTSNAANLQRRTYVRFDLAAAGIDSSKVTDVALQIYPLTKSGANEGKISAYELLNNSWLENTLTWNNAGNYPYNATAVDTVSIPANGQTYRLDVTNHVKSKLASGVPSFSFMLANTSDTNMAINLYGRPNALAPSLVISSKVMTPMQALNSAAASSEMKAMLGFLTGSLDLTDYQALPEAEKDKTAQRLIDLRPIGGYADANAVQAVLDSAAANPAAGVNLAATVQEMKTAIAAASGLNLAGYTALSATSQSAAAQWLIDGKPAGGYANLASVQAVLDLAVQVLSSPSGTVTIVNQADTYISQVAASVDNNYGTANSLQTSNASGLLRKVYVKFDLSAAGIPSNTVTDVKLQIYPLFKSTANMGKISAYEVYDNSWQENTLTWNNAVQYPSNATAIDTVSIPVTGQVYSLDVTSHVKSKLANGEPSFSFLLANTSDTNQSINLYGKPNAEAPRLVITRGMTAIQAWNSAESFSEMKAALAYFTDTSLDLTAYQALAQSQKDDVAQQLIDLRPTTGYASEAALQTVLDGLVQLV
ncbi:MAG: DNRLRE domain-containing protein [Paenibacillaceae bacterium]|nr:DNRLRE domain-containing protein [Paenibacillaceae bacterium]